MKTLSEYSELINRVENCNAVAVQAFDLDDAALVIFTFGEFDETSSAVIYDDDTVFTQWDWQSGYASSADEIEDYKWRLGVTEDEAVVVNGQPRLF